MPETTFNKTRVMAQTDMWDLAPDLKKMAESTNVIIPVSSKAERDALTGPGGGPVPDGTVVVRLDIGGVLDHRSGGAWVDGDTGWVNITPLAGFTAPTLQVRRIGQVAYLRGVVVRTAGEFANAYVDVFTIPAGFRTSLFIRNALPRYASGIAGSLLATFGTNGVVQIGATGASATDAYFNQSWPVG